MDAYPPLYTEHNLPLVLLSGLGEREDTGHQPHIPRRESGAKIHGDSPDSRTDLAERLLGELLALDGSDHAWNSGALPGPSGAIKYQMKTIGRSYTLPARKAAPQPRSPCLEGSPSPRSAELHSPLSPLSPGSPVFPDGIFTPMWFSKHQQQIPALFLAFFNLNANEASQDEQIKADINAIRGAMSRSGFKTRLAVVLISDKSILHAPEIEDRLGSIRRATTLDPKTGLFFMPPMSSQAEIATFAQDMMHTLQPSIVEYYRDLTKHARRKKARGGPPPSLYSPVGGSSQTTSASGWNVRYEVKQGVFAEFRQEMDVAERHYSAAIEELFSSEGGVLETTHSWSPRFNEARLLCDAVAIRVIRCQLWSGYTTGAAQSWQNYKLRVRDLVDRRGKGSLTYGWDAWEARWAEVMSELIQHSAIPSLQSPTADDAESLAASQTYAPHERPSNTPDRMPGLNLLHHSGYWLRLLAKGIKSRWEKALAIPDEDRIPPGQSPASMVASRSKNYDTYLALEPHEEATHDHVTELAFACDRAVQEFDARQQLRMSQQVRLDLAGDLIRAERFADALQVLIHLYEASAWREDEWRIPFSRLLVLLSDCASRDKSEAIAFLIPALTWELLSTTPVDMPSSALDIAGCLDSWPIDDKVELHMQSTNRLSPIVATFAFRSRESHVGEAFECQLVLDYATSETSRPMTLSKVEIVLGTKTLSIQHNENSKDKVSSIKLSDLPQAREAGEGRLETTADLHLTPRQRTIFRVSLYLREAVTHEVDSVTVFLETNKFTLSHRFASETILPGSLWYFEHGDDVANILVPHINPKAIAILPKPPRMQVLLHGLRNQYFTDEAIYLDIELINDEDGAVHATISPKVIGASGGACPVRWLDGEEDESVRTVTGLDASASNHGQLVIYGPPEAASFTLSLDLRYTLTSDTGTPLAKTISVEIPFVVPFEAKFMFVPRLHLSPWPSYFGHNNYTPRSAADGILQLWKLGCHFTSLVPDTLHIDQVELLVNGVDGESSCEIATSVIDRQFELSQTKKALSDFELTTQKSSLDDRQPSHLDLAVEVTWHHSGLSTPATTSITVPRLTVPASEPRVVCTMSSDGPHSARITYHLENPSAHFLTFALTMDAKDDFAFSGPKYRTLSLVPLSRHHVEYSVVLHGELEDSEPGRWITPNFQVMDSYYQKNLRVHPGGDRIKIDEKKEIAVWIGSEEPS
ncbi:hypothetical protein DOTSEDRAFT_145191 [Dothistroma septosporum NZE10]|uniref:Trafficking protein particle complex subunit 11 domain-containing protein n=1 Tax=Dothistroma septosporum (strain NZE10 / CBS 128990) TaxID=675120 RepID=N1Q5H8_DOTSN|nr:hypothetical protein DOTSEDRAFT_145191 [Dothistroma septosporum NZE10]